MTYILNSFSWGKDVAEPDKKEIRAETIQEVQIKLHEQWLNPQCFHVRITSDPDTRTPPRYKRRLHHMKSRPTKDRYLGRFFEQLVVPEGVRNARQDKRADLLRVQDFSFVTPISELYLPVQEVFFSDCRGKWERVDEKLCLDAGRSFDFTNLGEALAAAAYLPTKTEALLPENAGTWLYVSEVNVTGNRAEISFLMMERDRDFL